MTSAFSTPSSSCDEVLGNLPLYVGRDLDAADLTSIEDHLAGCAPCSEELQRAVKARHALLGLRSAIPAPLELNLWENGLGDRIRDEAPLGETPAESQPDTLAPIYRFRPLKVAGLAAAAGLLAVVGVQFLRTPEQGMAPGGASPNSSESPTTLVQGSPQPGSVGVTPVVGTQPLPPTPAVPSPKGTTPKVKVPQDSGYQLASNAQPAALAPPPFVVSCSTPGCEDAERIAEDAGGGLRRVYIENIDEYRRNMPVLGGPPTVVGPTSFRANPVRMVSGN